MISQVMIVLITIQMIFNIYLFITSQITKTKYGDLSREIEWNKKISSDENTILRNNKNSENKLLWEKLDRTSNILTLLMEKLGLKVIHSDDVIVRSNEPDSVQEHVLRGGSTMTTK